MNFEYKIYNDSNPPSIEDQKEALTRPRWSYLFALANIPGSDFKALQAKACKNPYCAYLFARDIAGANIKYCQEHACKDPIYAYYFAKYIPGADKKYCFKYVYPEERFGPDRWKSEYNKFIMQKACE